MAAFNGILTIGYNLDNVSQLGGPGAGVGGGIGPAGVEATFVKDGHGNLLYAGPSISLGVSTMPVELHGDQSTTFVSPPFNLGDLLQRVKVKAIGAVTTTTSTASTAQSKPPAGACGGGGNNDLLAE